MSARAAKLRRAGVLIDSNLLLLYVVGAYDVRFLPRFERTSRFGEADFERLNDFLAQFRRVLTTPQILTEVNSFLNHAGEPIRAEVFRVFARIVSALEEISIPSRDLVQHELFGRFGLTDAGVSRTAESESIVVLSLDHRLTGVLRKRGATVEPVSVADRRGAGGVLVIGD